MLLNLRNPHDGCDPCVLRGEVHRIDNPKEVDPFVWSVHVFVQSQLHLFYGDEISSAADSAIKNAEALSKASPGNFGVMIDKFHQGVTLYVAARRTKKRKYKYHAKKIRNLIGKWKQAGNPNVVYYSMFLDAENAALEGKHDKAEEHYKEAIKFVARSGFLHHAALFNELYSDYLQMQQGDFDEARYRLREAIQYYSDWGAVGKVERLKQSSLLV